jgi:pyruvate ferredoxin oxidoreductase alpha subunit
MARVQVVSAYPITPQTHCVETLAKFINDGRMDAKMVRAESEHSALSAVAGASLVGARTFTATSSQGLQLMSEVLYMVSGLRQPIVMAVANRTLSQPVNIWCDHQDSMVNRDSGWMQIYCRSPQEVYDTILQAYSVAEDPRALVPVMVCYDGFLVSHVADSLEIPAQEEVDAFLPPPGPNGRPIMDPSDPMQFGEVVYPDWYPDFEYRKDRALLDSLSVLEEVQGAFADAFDRRYRHLHAYGTDDAEIVLVGMGTMMDTARWVARKRRDAGEKVGVIALRTYRPFPAKEVAEALKGAAVVAVLDRDIGYGTGGMLHSDVLRALYSSAERPTCANFIVGLGGKDVSVDTLEKCIETAKGLTGKPSPEAAFWPDARTAGVG